MTGKAAPMKTNFRRRPRRSNSLKDLQRLLGAARTVYGSGKDRLASHAKYFVQLLTEMLETGAVRDPAARSILRSITNNSRAARPEPA
jgi:CRISPR/Cas system CSM-associated protein Csm2 small subunit